MKQHSAVLHEVERVTPEADKGLTSQQVSERVAARKTNFVKKTIGKSYLSIFTSNIFTFFNLLGIIIFVLMLICGSVENMFFFVVILANTAIGIFQEIRSKRIVERLAIVQQPNVTVVRDGKEQTIAVSNVVLDDIVVYSSGKQICADSIVVDGEVEVNESLLTGESDAVKKRAGDTLYSGSFVVSGNCRARADKVGADNYAEQLQSKVKKYKKANSELMRSITFIIKCISWIIFPLGLATFFKDLRNVTQFQDALKSAAGSMIGMVPSGMVLLTSVALAVSVIRLARRNVWVRELYCIEMLARVDTLCMDKTGTITDGTMTVESVEILDDKYNKDKIAQLISSLVVATKDDNLTAVALKKAFGHTAVFQSTAVIPFSSKRKFSAATLQGVGTVAIGAGEFMLKKAHKKHNDVSQQLLSQGLRVLTVCVSDNEINGDVVGELRPVAIVALSDTLRSDAKEIVEWFKSNNVAVKVISGDNPLSVSVIAAKVGVENADKYISLEGMTDEQVRECANSYTVFGRVSPEQKELLVNALKAEGHTVAMTGDGVNDILAMRASDCAISVACGSDAAKNVAQLVLTDNQFGSMPKVVAEGRRVVNNIQNSSSLFLMKTTMTILTTILLLCLWNYSYPFQPQNLYAMEFFIIGIASFLLALKPNTNLIKGKFLTNTLKATLPSGLAMFLSVAMTYAFSGVVGIAGNDQQVSTVAMFSMTATGLCALWILLYPYDKINIGIGALSTAGTVGCYLLFPIIMQWLGGVGGGDYDPMYVAIPDSAIWFIAINAVVMAVLIIVGKVIIRTVDAKRNKEEADK